MDEQLGPLQEVFEDLKKKWREMQDEEPFLDMIKGFIHAIDWKVSGLLSNYEPLTNHVRCIYCMSACIWSLVLENLKDKCNVIPLPHAQETWIRVLIAIQLVVFLLALFARKRAILQGVIFLAAGVDTMFVKCIFSHTFC